MTTWLVLTLLLFATTADVTDLVTLSLQLFSLVYFLPLQHLWMDSLVPTLWIPGKSRSPLKMYKQTIFMTNFTPYSMPPKF